VTPAAGRDDPAFLIEENGLGAAGADVDADEEAHGMDGTCAAGLQRASRSKNDGPGRNAITFRPGTVRSIDASLDAPCLDARHQGFKPAQ
jgi:hypothetical protein